MIYTTSVLEEFNRQLRKLLKIIKLHSFSIHKNTKNITGNYVSSYIIY